MKYVLACLAVAALVVPAEAQSCGFPGVSVSVAPQIATPGQPILVTLTNNSSQAIEVHCGGAMIRQVFASSSCGGSPVFTAGCVAPAFATIQPGDTWLETWNQLDDDGNQVPEGTYSLDIRYTGGGLNFQCCVPVTICSTPSTPAVSYCTAGTSALGCRASLWSFGTLSASAGEGFVVQAFGVETDREGMLLYGQNGRQSNVWGNGTSYQCVAPPVRRGGLLKSPTIGALCAGSLRQDLNARWCASCPKPSHAPTPGQKMQIQLWYRDPWSTSNQTTSLSDALEADVCP
jgi:hypothetical protein